MRSTTLCPSDEAASFLDDGPDSCHPGVSLPELTHVKEAKVDCRCMAEVPCIAQLNGVLEGAAMVSFQRHLAESRLPFDSKCDIF